MAENLNNCGQHAQAIQDLLGCVMEKSGVAAGVYVDSKIQELVNIHNVNITDLTNAINAINSELDEDDTALAGILNQLTTLNNKVTANETNITTVNNALTTAISNFNQQVADERAYVNSEIARLEALMPNAYDDTEVRQLIATNIAAISTEAETRAAEVLRLEGIINQNSSNIGLLQTKVEQNITDILANSTAIANVAAALNAFKVEINARVQAVEDCLSSFFTGLSGIDCDTLAAKFSAGLSAGGAGQSGL